MISEKKRRRIRRLAEKTLGEEKAAALQKASFADLGFGFDKFGFDRDGAVYFYSLLSMAYKHYFRVESFGHDNVPRAGRAILAPNRGGVLSLGGALIALDLILKSDPPRFARTASGSAFRRYPYLGTLLARIGRVASGAADLADLLAGEELVVFFPEETGGAARFRRERYRLRPFGTDVVKLALVNRAPVVPVAVIGVEEQSVVLYNVESLANFLGLPYFPITPTFPLLGLPGLLPYPSKCFIYYGEPILFHEEYPPEAAERPGILEDLAEDVREAVQELIDKGLKERKRRQSLVKSGRKR